MDFFTKIQLFLNPKGLFEIRRPKLNGAFTTWSHCSELSLLVGLLHNRVFKTKENDVSTVVVLLFLDVATNL